MSDTTKDSVYRKEYREFLTKLQRFHDGKRTSFTRVPSFGGKDLDLGLLYRTVTSLGGFSKVTDEKKWSEVAKCLNLPLKCTNGAFALRQHYVRYLEHYERVNFFGEDTEDTVVDGTRQGLTLAGVRTVLPGPSFATLGATDLVKPPAFGPLGELKTHNFSKLMLSLASGLPNEVDFALNICTLLSNVTNSIFNLAKAPGIVDLMLLHAGIWTKDTLNAQDMYKEWYQESERDFVKFWREALDDNCAKELFESGLSGSDLIERIDDNGRDDSNYESELFADCTVDVNHPETNRVLQICVILHNFSFEDLNAMFLATHRGAKRFLMLCAGTRQATLRKIALDTLDNLSDRFTLTRLVDQENQKFLQMLHSFLDSRDRLRRVRAMTILAKLASCEDNEEILSEGMTLQAYESLIRSLTIPDIQIILASLDSLYFLSHLGEATSTSIAMVYGAIDVLICLITVHAESYGNRAIAGFRIVENKNSIFSQKHHAQRALKQTGMRHGPPQVSHPSGPPNLAAQPFMRTQLPPARPPSLIPESQRQPQAQSDGDETEEIDAEVFTAQWISAFYELSPGHTLSRSDMYSDYLVTCNRLGRLGILPASNFNKILRMVIPEQHLQGAQTNMDGHYNISGVKRRATPLSVSSRVPRQRASVPVVGLHGGSPRPVGMTANMVQNQCVGIPSLPMQRPVAPPFMAGQRPALSLENFQPPRLRPEFTNVSMRPGFHGAPPPLTGPGPGPGPGQQGMVALSSVPQPLPVSKEGVPKDTSVKLPTTPTTNEAMKLPTSVPPNMCLAPGIGGNPVNPGGPLPPNTISLPVTPTGQDGVNQYQTTMEHIRREMQQHYMQFHFHRQQIQNIQAQLQQAVHQSQVQQLPQSMMEEVQTRVRNHHSQMQLHYQKLQQLQMLMQQVQQKAAQEQSTGKEISNDNLPLSPKSKRNKKNVPQTPKQAAPPLQNMMDRNSPQQRAFPIPPSFPGSPMQVNSIGSPFPVSVPLSYVQTPHVNSNATTENTHNASLMKENHSNASRGLSSPHVPSSGPLPILNGLQGSTADPNSVSQAFQTQVKVSNETSITLTPVRIGLQQQQADMTSQTGLCQTTLDASGKPNQNPPTLPPVPPLTQTSQPPMTFQNAIAAVSSTQVITPNNQSTRFMILQGPQHIIAQNGTQRTLPPNAMVMMPAVAGQPFAPFIGRFPQMPVQAPPQDNRPQPILPKDNSNADTQLSRTSLPIVKIQGSLQPVSSEPLKLPSSSAPSSTALSILPPGGAPVLPPANVPPGGPAVVHSTLPPTTAVSTIGESSTASSLPVQLRAAQNFSIPVHQQNGSLHTEGKLEDLSSQGQPQKPQTSLLPPIAPSTLGATPPSNTTTPFIPSINVPPKVLNASTKSKDEGTEHNLARPINHVEQAKRLCDELFEKEAFDKDNKRLKLAEEVTKLDKQEKSVNVLNGVLDSKILQKHDRNIDKHDVWFNGLHSPNSIKNKENGISKHIDLVGDGNDSNPISKAINSDKKQSSDVELRPEHGKTSSDQSNINESITNDRVSSETPSKSEGDVPTKISLLNYSINEKDAKTMESLESTETLPSKTDSKSSTINLSPVGKKRECLWDGCSSSFTTSSNLLSHMVCAHAPGEGQLGICRVPGCSSVQRPRGSMICHFQQRHCNRSGAGDDLPLVTLPELLFPKVADLEKKEDESPVTRSVRLTSALILRNIARNSSYGRQLIRSFERRLVLSAMSTSEASGAVSSCLAELSKTRTSKCSFSEQES